MSQAEGTTMQVERAVKWNRYKSRQVYRPLLPGETRVLCLAPGHFDDALVASLQTTALYRMKDVLYPDDNYQGGYEAISYAWGAVILDHDLALEGHGMIKITAAISTALRYFRLANDTRYLWADAICIDQSNNTEKGKQVDMMGLIFGQASNVLVWLGTSGQRDTLAFATINACDTWFQRNSKGIGTFHPWNREIIPKLRLYLEESSSCACCNKQIVHTDHALEEGFAAVAFLLQRNYFSRLWVVQEVVRNETIEIYCGHHHVSWDLFFDCQDGVREAKTSKELFQKPLHSIYMRWFVEGFNNIKQVDIYRKIYNQAYMGDMLLDGLIEFSNRKCYNPRDRLYAIIGMYASDATGDFQSDYDVDPITLYRDVTALCLTNTAAGAGKPYASALFALAGTERFAMSDRKPEGDELRPSWVPYYHDLSYRSLRKIKYYKSGDLYGARPARGVKTPYVDCRISVKNPYHLQLRGKFLGVISAICFGSGPPVFYQDETWVQSVPSLVSWYINCRNFLHEEGLSHMEETGLKSLLNYEHLPGDDGESIVLQTNQDKGQQALLDFDSFVQIVKEVQVEPEEDQIIDPKIAYQVLSNSMQGITVLPDHNINMCVIHTGSSKRLAWVPNAAHENDHVVTCIGALQPLVIRGRSPDRLVLPPRFRLIGDAWILGINQEDASDIRDGKLSSTCDQSLQWITLE